VTRSADDFVGRDRDVRRRTATPVCSRRRPIGRRRRGFSYIEAAISSTILAVGIVSALHLYGSYAKGVLQANETAAAQELAAGLMAEITAQAFEDADYAHGSFGLGVGETDRTDFDDVDDYDGWTEAPPQAADGSELTGYEGFVRSVDVYNVNANNLTTSAIAGSTDAKRIVVSVTRNGRLRARLEAVKMYQDETAPVRTKLDVFDLEWLLK